MNKTYKFDKDYKVTYPYGVWAEPQVEIIKGDYKGLIFDIVSSYITSSPNEESISSDFTVNYKIIKLCDDENMTTIDSRIINQIVLNYIKVK